MFTRLLVLACLAGLSHADGASDQASDSTYTQIIEQYRKGDDDAVMRLARLDAKAIESGERDVVKAFEEAPIQASRGTRLLRAAIVAHTDAAIAGRLGTFAIRWSPHMALAQRYVERLASKNRDDPVAVHWWFMAIGAMQAQRNYGQAMTTARRARQVCGDRPEFLFALGVTNELAWVWEHEENLRSPFSGSLDEAEKAYARVLTLAPRFLDARVRLGRVRTLRGDNQGAVRTLAGIPDSAPSVLVYLARLFEGDALERQGSREEARTRYDAATRIGPHAQSAQLALAYTQYQDGARVEAAGRVRETLADPGTGKDNDPWFWYSLGLGALVGPELSALRALVRQ